jgi:aspartate aminotransferase
MRTLAARLSAVQASATVELADTASRLRRQGVRVIDLSAGRACDPTPDYICEAAISALRSGDTHQTMSAGTPDFREAVAAKLLRDNALDADPFQEVVATAGVKQGLTLTFMATLDPGDEVIVEDPCFVSYQPLIRLAGGVPVSVPLRVENRFRWTASDLERAVTPRTRAILFNSPHNPTGVVHTADDLAVITEVAHRHDLLVVSDEVYERVVWGGRQHVSIASCAGMRDRTVTVMGLTKTFAMGGWRIGFAFAPPGIAAAMVRLQQHLLTCASSIAQAGARAALGMEPREEVRALWNDWERRCAYVAGQLDAIPGVRCAPPEGGFYAWPDITAFGVSSEAIAAKLLNDHHVALVPGSAFGPGGEGRLRITCVRGWPELREAVDRLRNALTA